MQHDTPRIIALLLFLLPSLVLAGSIESIEIRGNKKIETEAIRQKISSKVGEALSDERVRSDIQAIHGLGYFDQIEVLEEPFGKGSKLLYQVKERPTISKVSFEGLDAIDDTEAKELVEVKDYQVLDVHKLNEGIQKLTAKYEEKGYYLADVRYDLEEDKGKNEVVVTFKIQENDKVQVKTINIVGNKVLTDDDLKAVMQTKEGGSFSWLTGSGAYREAMFERDLAALGFYYGTQGYIKARFGKPQVSVSADKKFISISISIDEGLQYSVGNVDFRGDLLYTKTELLEDLQLVSGEIFNAETLRRETLRYTEKYSDLGYAFANVVPQPTIHDDTKTVDITFDVEKGERVYIGKISITGNTKTKDRVIRRELSIFEGELFNGTKKRLSKENVTRLGFFDTVEFHQSTSRSSPNIVDIEIRVKERSTGQLVIGAGYASGNIGFTAHAQLSQNNFLGNGQVASLSAEILTGQKLYQFNLSFTEPYLGASLWSLGGSLYQIRRELNTLGSAPTFVEIKSGADIRLGHPIMEFTQLFLTYKLENSAVDPSTIIDTEVIKPQSVNGITSSLATSVVYDKRDDRMDPRKGWFWSLSGELAGVGGDRFYLKNRAELKYFHPIVWDFIFRSQVKLGAISRTTDADVPFNELFIQGGIFSLRGYPNLSLGPTVTLSPPGSPSLSAAATAANLGGKEIVKGGQYEMQFNAEIEFPLLKEARIRGVLFFDAGNAFTGKLFAQNPPLFANFGWGFRWFTPIGPLRFEFGYPIVSIPGREIPKLQFNFTIGPPF